MDVSKNSGFSPQKNHPLKNRVVFPWVFHHPFWGVCLTSDVLEATQMDQGSFPHDFRTEPPQCLFQELSVNTTVAPARKLSTPEPLKGAKQVPGGE